MVLLLTTSWWDVKLIIGAALISSGYLLKRFAGMSLHISLIGKNSLIE